MKQNDVTSKTTTKQNRIVFVAFANSVFSKSTQRLQSQFQASKETLELIDKFYFFSEKDLDKDFYHNLKPWLYRRGYGYMRWKPYLIKRVFDNLSEGDALIYSDIGCDYNGKAVSRLKEYIELARRSETGVVVFQDTEIESERNKGDVLDFFNVRNNESVCSTNQIISCLVVLVKKNISTEVVDKWADICINHMDLVTDKRSTSPNLNGFIEHRHDQSILSILSKLYNVAQMPSRELSKENFQNIPFSPSRHKEKYRSVQLKRYFLLPLRWVIGMYLKHIEHFYFSGRIAW